MFSAIYRYFFKNKKDLNDNTKEVSTEVPEVPEVSTEVHKEITEVPTEVPEVSTEVHKEVPEVPTEVPEVSTEVHKEVPEVPTEVPEVHTENSTNHLLELFNKSHRGILYEDLDILLKNAYTESQIYTLKCLAHLRDSVTGRGERDLSKKIYRWLETNCEEQLIKNMELFIHKYGRWDDFVYLPLGSNASNHYLSLMSKQLNVDLENMKTGCAVSKVAKWIPSEKSNGYNHTGFNKELAKMMGLTNAALKKTYLTPLRKYISGMEQQECIEIKYECKTDYSVNEMMDILSNSQYDDICCIEKF